MERLSKDNLSSLLRTIINYGHKKFYDTGPWYYPQTIYTRLERPARAKRSSLFVPLVSYQDNIFVNTVPGPLLTGSSLILVDLSDKWRHDIQRNDTFPRWQTIHLSLAYRQ